MGPLLFLHLSVILVVTQLISNVHGLPYFRNRIPNGFNVTNPCKPSEVWNGVGHQYVDGGGARNQFGLDFANNNFIYNSTLCRIDSDGDGRTNGEELGDPNCTWTEGAIPLITTGITHPGICEPLSLPNCVSKNSWLTCKEFYCKAFNDSATKTVDLTFPRTPVPAESTTYICLGFELPSDKKYHMVAMKPIIDNVNFIHHMGVFACPKPLETSLMEKPEYCQMAVANCLTFIGGWTVGIGGYCFPDDVGLAMGAGSYRYVILQLHWTNPSLISGQFDASGMTFYYTEVLRPKEAMITMVGQLSLTIPPGQESVEAVGRCTSKCTSAIGTNKKMQIITAVLHMHLLGRFGEVILIHNGSETTLVSDANYDYHIPRMFEFRPYYDFYPGDEIKLICRFNSTGRKNETNYGQATKDEMCYVALVVIPDVPLFSLCGQYKSTDICRISDDITYADCDVQMLQQSLGAVAVFCNTDCSPQCLQFIQGMKASRCFDVEIGGFIRQFWPIDDARAGPLFQLADYCTAKTMASTTTYGQSSAASGSQGSSTSMGAGMSTSMGGGGGSSMSVGPGMSTNPGAGGSSVGPGMSTSVGGTGEGGGGKKWPVIVSSAVAGGILVAIILFVACCPWDRNWFFQPSLYSSRQF